MFIILLPVINHLSQLQAPAEICHSTLPKSTLMGSASSPDLSGPFLQYRPAVLCLGHKECLSGSIWRNRTLMFTECNYQLCIVQQKLIFP